MRIATTVILSLLLCGPAVVSSRAAEPSTDEQKTFYALGLIISQSLGPFALTESELDLVKSGMTDGVLKKSPKVDLQTYGPMRSTTMLIYARRQPRPRLKRQPVPPS